MSNSIYLVLEGDDNDIRGVFSKYEYAQGFIETAGKADDAYTDDMTIEEHEVDSPETMNLVIKEHWQVSVWLDSGWMTPGYSNHEGEAGKLHRQGVGVAVSNSIDYNIDLYYQLPNKKKPYLIVTSYKSLEEARKLAQLQLENYGLTGGFVDTGRNGKDEEIYTGSLRKQ